MLCDLVKKNRSYRAFKSGESIPVDFLREWVSNARLCPSARNTQPLKYRLVTNEEECAAVLPATYWAGSLGLELPPRGHAPTAYIVICHDTSLCEPNHFSYMDVGIAAQTIMLSAAEDGFGGCMIGSAKADVITEALGIPEHLKVELVLGLGVPDEKVVLVNAREGAVRYYRDKENTHYVPKRPLDEIMI